MSRALSSSLLSFSCINLKNNSLFSFFLFFSLSTAVIFIIFSSTFAESAPYFISRVDSVVSPRPAQKAVASALLRSASATPSVTGNIINLATCTSSSTNNYFFTFNASSMTFSSSSSFLLLLSVCCLAVVVVVDFLLPFGSLPNTPRKR